MPVDIRSFAYKVVGGFLGGWVSEFVTNHPEWFGMLGNYAVPVVGTALGLGSQYLADKGYIPYELARILEYSGAMAVGNWVWEQIKKGFGGGASARIGTRGTRAVTVYVPPVEKKLKEAIVL